MYDIGKWSLSAWFYVLLIVGSCNLSMLIVRPKNQNLTRGVEIRYPYMVGICAMRVVTRADLRGCMVGDRGRPIVRRNRGPCLAITL